MAQKTKLVVPKRRSPRQARALDTVEVIFEAVARIIEQDGEASLTTNRIAERAGIAIGTLYGYFPNKEEILLALARRELQRTQDAVQEVLDVPAPPLDTARIAIRALMRGFGGRNRLRRVLIETVMAQGRHLELARGVAAIAQRMVDADQRPSLGTWSMTEAQAFVLTQAVAGVIRAATLEGSPLMGTTALEDELLRLCRTYVADLAPISSRQDASDS